ncbi:MAG: hypothetical protein OEV99_16515 [Nitrospira sp.]|nr:hypothetical protein [Nitrospira sp.]MDH4371426.1 hypothetical protein [Nitrospira sp.]MDH5347682.1 hypothetical protein [Nitrospira sp.]MDH5499028.1 hypothetical protein [Nitrospira sp.]MDH5726439.1 hypothetical protein [Nitrospira sp.]
MCISSGFKIATIVGLLGLVAGCVPAHPYSMQVDGEKVVVEVLMPDEMKAQGTGGGKLVAPGIATDAVPVAIHYATKATTPVLNEDTIEHTATYSGVKAASKFYADEKTGFSVQFGGVRITRSIVNDGKSQTAAILTFAVDAQELASNGQLQFVGDSALVHFGKVKVEDRKWYIPWTWRMKVRDRIDADVNIVIEGHWMDGNEVSHREDLADLHLRLRDLKLGDTTDISAVRSEWFPLIPRTKKPKQGTGTYVVKVRVTEYDDYGKLVNEVSDEVSTNKADWVKKIKRSVMPTP